MTKESASHDRLSGSGKPDSCPNICVYNKTCHRVRLADPVLLCESGGIGRRTRLRIWRRKAWGFESPLSHQLSSSKTKPENAEEAEAAEVFGGLAAAPARKLRRRTKISDQRYNPKLLCYLCVSRFCL